MKSRNVLRSSMAGVNQTAAKPSSATTRPASETHRRP
jgi:hypothetical protein